MNYKKVYNSLITKRKTCKFEGYTETHHILPKSLGGTNDRSNLVQLTAREHFIAHLLLVKMYTPGTIEWIKMQKALMLMYSESFYQCRYTPSKWYAKCKENISIANSISQSGKGNSQYGKIWIFNTKLKQSKSIFKDELDKYLEAGWKKGRVVDWNKFDSKLDRKLNNKLARTNKYHKKKIQNIELYTKYYQIYNEYGWKKFLEMTGYNKSKPNLVRQFQKYVKEFKPQNGKKRGKSTSQIIK